MADTSKTTLIMKRSFNVPVEKVFEAWTNSELMKKWFFTMEHTNKVTKNDPRVGGSWEVVDHREGKDYRAIGEYIEMESPHKIVFTFQMPQFSDLHDILTVELNSAEDGTEMTFTQEITVIHEEDWTAEDIEKAHEDWKRETEQGWHYMFLGLKQLLETGKIEYPNF
ncbi:SRPBCC family protein [Bacillus sinesaloumensis]|uniref:SRPBCC family protein n=1 Tax=Litchfieldia sinesaloumensis TaxID=1926280 RepID=UPI000988617C|nr:SRPBCC family protein [Bacillus sinesaloumensis]